MRRRVCKSSLHLEDEDAGPLLRHCERSEAIQSAAAEGFWIASAFAKASADKSLRSQ
jgi:hypothetical protein